MAPTIQSAFGTFIGTLTATGASMVNAFLTLFTAIIAFAQAIVAAIVHSGLSIVQLGVDLCQGVAGFIFANFFVILILSGGYYWWTSRSQSQKGKTTISRK